MEGAAAGMAAVGVHGFPAVLTSFVGREQAVRQVADLLGEYRLVTVTGPGGVGKTRLAGEVARLVAARFADGAWLAGLAVVRASARVAVAVAVTLGVREQPGGAGGGCSNAGAGPAAAAAGGVPPGSAQAVPACRPGPGAGTGRLVRCCARPDGRHLSPDSSASGIGPVPDLACSLPGNARTRRRPGGRQHNLASGLTRPHPG
jgi:hypothetical protein